MKENERERKKKEGREGGKKERERRGRGDQSTNISNTVYLSSVLR